MKHCEKKALSLTEVLVSLAILVVLAWLALPFVAGTCGRGGMTETLSNMRQLHKATQQMAMESAQTLKAGWPGDTGGTYSNWVGNLVGGGYLSTNDLCKLLSGPGRNFPSGKIPPSTSSAVLVYAVKADSPEKIVFLSTANFTNTPSGGTQPLANSTPYGKKGFVVFRRGGDGAILKGRKAGDTNLIGGFAPLCQ